MVFDWPNCSNKRMLFAGSKQELSAAKAKRLPFAAIGYQMHDARETSTDHQLAGSGYEQRTEDMSEQSSRPTPTNTAGAKLVNLYKPVGIAALNAAAMCRKPGGLGKSGK